MAEENIVYENVEDEAGERIATNGHYTGMHLGTVTQDAAEGADNAAYYTERETVRKGTLLGDDADTDFPVIDEE